jgi:hypothetical protein
MKSGRMKSGRHVARMGEIRNSYNMLVGKSEERTPLKNPGIDRKIMLEL